MHPILLSRHAVQCLHVVVLLLCMMGCGASTEDILRQTREAFGLEVGTPQRPVVERHTARGLDSEVYLLIKLPEGESPTALIRQAPRGLVHKPYHADRYSLRSPPAWEAFLKSSPESITEYLQYPYSDAMISGPRYSLTVLPDEDRCALRIIWLQY